MESFWDVASHPEKHRFDDTLDQFNNGGNDFNGEGLTVAGKDHLEAISPFNSCGSPSEFSSVVDARNASVSTMRVLETSKLYDFHNSEDSLAAWVEAVNNPAVCRERQGEVSREMIILLDQLFLVSNNR